MRLLKGRNEVLNCFASSEIERMQNATFQSIYSENWEILLILVWLTKRDAFYIIRPYGDIFKGLIFYTKGNGYQENYIPGWN